MGHTSALTLKFLTASPLTVLHHQTGVSGEGRRGRGGAQRGADITGERGLTTYDAENEGEYMYLIFQNRSEISV